MLCPFCRKKDTSVVDSRPSEDGTAIRRRRVCLCERKERFTTFERVQFRELTVIKSNGRRAPFDTQKMTITSGIRLGSQAATTRGFGLNEFKKVGDLITKVIEGLSKNSVNNSKVESEVKKEVIELCAKFPIYNHLVKN